MFGLSFRENVQLFEECLGRLGRDFLGLPNRRVLPRCELSITFNSLLCVLDRICTEVLDFAWRKIDVDIGIEILLLSDFVCLGVFFSAIAVWLGNPPAKKTTDGRKRF
jgi:hypothetical protein